MNMNLPKCNPFWSILQKHRIEVACMPSSDKNNKNSRLSHYSSHFLNRYIIYGLLVKHEIKVVEYWPNYFITKLGPKQSQDPAVLTGIVFNF